MGSANNVTRNAKTAAITDANQMPTTNHAMSATSPAITTAATSRLRAARSMAPTMSNPIRRKGMGIPSRLELSKRGCGAGGAGNVSPSTTRMIRMIRSTPAEIPPAKSPFLNLGVMISSMMRLVVTSVSAP